MSGLTRCAGSIAGLAKTLGPLLPAHQADELLVPASDGLVVSFEATSPILGAVL